MTPILPSPLPDPDEPSDEQLAELEAVLDDGDRWAFTRWLFASAPIDFQDWLATLPDDDERTAA